MDAPLAPYLPRFSSSPALTLMLPPSPQLDAFEDETLQTITESELQLELEAEPSITLSVADYEAHVMEAGQSVRRELEAEHAASLEDAETRHAEALAAAVSAVEAARDAEHGAAIASQIASAMTTMREAVSHDIARALRPLLDEAIVARTAAAVAKAIAGVIADPDHPTLTVSGPGPLLAAIESALEDGVAVEFTATDDDDVTVAANGIHIETRLAQALTALTEGDA